MSAVVRRESLWKSRWPGVLLLLADVVGFSLAWQGAWWLRRTLNHWFDLPINALDPYLQVHLLVVAIGVLNALLFGLYRVRHRLSSLTRWEQLLRVGYHYLLYMMVIGYFFKELDLGRSVILIASVLAFVYLYISRTAFRVLKTRAFEQRRGLVRAAIVGMGPLALEVRTALADHPEIGFDIIGLIRQPDEQVTVTPPPDLPVLGETTALTDILERHDIEDVFYAVPHLSTADQLNLISVGRRPGTRVMLVSNMFGVLTSHAKVDEISAFPVIPLRDGHLARSEAILKRLFDLFVAGVGTVLWLVLMHWWIALLIKRDSPGPVFFRQERVGRDGTRFSILKYRTMHVNAEAYAVAPTESDDPRITRMGRWLRRTSLDEFPQLLNVLAGDMSMVGPRPEMPFIVDKYQEWQKRRLDVKPGITGLWQVIGRKNLPLHLNMEYDFYYIMNQSLMLDIQILIRTIPAVLTGRGAF